MLPTATIQQRYHIITAASAATTTTTALTTATTTTLTTTTRTTAPPPLPLPLPAAAVRQSSQTTVDTKATTMLNAPTSTTTTTPTSILASKLLKSELRYVPATAAGAATAQNNVATNLGALHRGLPTTTMAATSASATATLLQVVSDSLVNSKGVVRANSGASPMATTSIIPPLAFIANGTSAINATQIAPINVVLTGTDGTAILATTTTPAGLSGSILIRSQPQFVTNSRPNPTALQSQQQHHYQQQQQHQPRQQHHNTTSTTGAAILPILNQDMVKQIVIGNECTPRTLLKATQKPTRPIIRHQSVVLQQKQRKSNSFQPNQQHTVQATKSPTSLAPKVPGKSQQISQEPSKAAITTSNTPLMASTMNKELLKHSEICTNTAMNGNESVSALASSNSVDVDTLAMLTLPSEEATSERVESEQTQSVEQSLKLLDAMKNDVQTITIDDDENEDAPKLYSQLCDDVHKVQEKCVNTIRKTPLSNNNTQDDFKEHALTKLMSHPSNKDLAVNQQSQIPTQNPRTKRSQSLNQANLKLSKSSNNLNSAERRRSTALEINAIHLNASLNFDSKNKKIELENSTMQSQNNKLNKQHVPDSDNEDQLVVLIEDKSMSEKLQIDLDVYENSLDDNENHKENCTNEHQINEIQIPCPKSNVNENNLQQDEETLIFESGKQATKQLNVPLKVETPNQMDLTENITRSLLQSLNENTNTIKDVSNIDDNCKLESISATTVDNNIVSTLQDTELSLSPTINKVIEQSSREMSYNVKTNIKQHGEIVKKRRKNNEDIEEQLDKSELICDEQIQISSSSSSSNCSANNFSPPEQKLKNINNRNSNNVMHWQAPLPVSKLKNNAKSTQHIYGSEANTFSTVLNALSNYNMLTWKERIGTANGTPMRFHLNEFNLLEIHERCPPRYRIHTAYEKPIYERDAKHASDGEDTEIDPLLYLCRRCNCHGPAVDFLAPGFCSLDCLKRENRKRSRTGGNTRKRPRKEPVSTSGCGLPMKLPGNATLAQPTEENGLGGMKKHFRWSTYLRGKYNNVAAPIDHFLNPFPTGPNPFQVGMKLEAIDPENCSLFCVCTVVEIQGYRLKLKFDGYDSMYDFWINADSMDIFPPGWCAKTNRILQPPKNMDVNKFSWNWYLGKQKATPAHRQLFTHLNASALPSRNPFQIGMHLEAEDLNDTGKLCVATVADVLEDRIRVHFDGWDNCYDYWVDINSPYIHPCGWHQGRQQLIVPPEFENSSFHWPSYIERQKSGIAAPAEFFEAREAIDFRPQMKLEVVDPRNPSLIRPATVQTRKGHRVKLHLDCWPSEYCFWVEDDSPDMHPIGWCDATVHELEPPPGYNMRPVQRPCNTVGCRGIGNAKYFFLSMHSTRDCCPYATENWRQKVEKPPRINLDKIVRPPPALANIKAAPVENIKNNQNRQHQPTLRSTQNDANTKATSRYMSDKQTLSRFQSLENVNTRSSNRSESRQCKTATSTLSEDDEKIQLMQIKQEVKDETRVTMDPMPPMPVNLDCIDLKIAKNFLCDYGPRLRQNYDVWQGNMSFDDTCVDRNPLQWTTDETVQFVEQILGCKTTADFFKREDIDGIALLMLQQSDLTELLGMRLGPAVKLFAHILQLRMITARKYNSTNIAFNETANVGDRY